MKDHPGSFFKAEDPRMLNEELVMVLGYVAYQTETGDKSGTDVFDVFVRNDKISARVRDKNNVTSVLDKAAREDADEFLHSLGCVDEYLVKLEVLTGEEFRNLKPLFSNSKGQMSSYQQECLPPLDSSCATRRCVAAAASGYIYARAEGVF